MNNKNLILEKLTLVMPTYQRQKYALRNMRYWSDTNVTLMVLDGSEDPINSKILNSFGANIVYINDPSSIEQRLNKAHFKINTEYVALIGDDEFYVVSAVKSCIQELEKDDSLIACCGSCLGFYFNKKSSDIYGWRP